MHVNKKKVRGYRGLKLKHVSQQSSGGTKSPTDEWQTLVLHAKEIASGTWNVVKSTNTSVSFARFEKAGKAGTGKSFLVQEIFKSLVRSGKRVRIVCSSGIAGTVYTETNASTVHSFYRLRTAELQWKQLVERSCRDSQVVQNIQRLDCLIWDEVSMSRRRMLELANLIHLHVNKALHRPMPFDGIQLVLVGDFQQLRPVLGLFDKGQFMFKSPIFQQAIPHRFKLTQSMRQDESEKEFLACLDELRAGTCSTESEILIQELKRELPEELEEEATHIFFVRYQLGCLTLPS